MGEGRARSLLHRGQVDELLPVSDEGGAVSLASEGSSQAGSVPHEGRLGPDLPEAEGLGRLFAVGKDKQ